MDETPRRDGRITETLTFRVLVAANAIAQPFAERVGRANDLSLAEWRCMMALAAWPDSSGEDVARALFMDRMNVSRCLRRLESVGRVARRADPHHGRRFLWRMTDEGWAVYERIVPSALARDNAAFADVSPEDRARVEALLLRYATVG